jgi:hypothetical protein
MVQLVTVLVQLARSALYPLLPLSLPEVNMYHLIAHRLQSKYSPSLLLPPFQIIRRSSFSRYIIFVMHLDIVYN